MGSGLRPASAQRAGEGHAEAPRNEPRPLGLLGTRAGAPRLTVVGGEFEEASWGTSGASSPQVGQLLLTPTDLRAGAVDLVAPVTIRPIAALRAFACRANYPTRFLRLRRDILPSGLRLEYTQPRLVRHAANATTTPTAPASPRPDATRLRAPRCHPRPRRIGAFSVISSGAAHREPAGGGLALKVELRSLARPLHRRRRGKRSSVAHFTGEACLIVRTRTRLPMPDHPRP